MLSTSLPSGTNKNINVIGEAGSLSRLLDSDIKEFQDLYLKYFNQTISREEARKELALLVRQTQIVYQPINIQQLNRLFKGSTTDGFN